MTRRSRLTRRHWVIIQAALLVTMLFVALRMAGPPKVYALAGLLVLILVVAIVSRVQTSRGAQRLPR